MRRLIVVGSAIVIAVALLLALAPAALATDCTCPTDCKSPGYWKTHDWPVAGVCIAGVWYPQATAQPMMKQVPGDKWSTLFRSLVAAKLNVANGCYASCHVRWCIRAADAWLARNCSPVAASSEAWQCGGECLYWCLDGYNNS
jgi:hypothetical protein